MINPSQPGAEFFSSAEPVVAQVVSVKPMIELEQVTKRYGAKTAVDHLSLQIAAGELFALLGPNGAGKTTTIKLMCGLLFPTSGRIRVGGYDLQRQGDQARQLLSYIP